MSLRHTSPLVVAAAVVLLPACEQITTTEPQIGLQDPEPEPKLPMAEAPSEGVAIYKDPSPPSSPPILPLPSAAPVVSELQIRLERTGAKTGDIQISLGWNNTNDIDLHVTEPSGETISFVQRRSRTGGELDVDTNAGSGNTRNAVENIYWPSGQAPEGEYVVVVHHYAKYDRKNKTAFGVLIKYGDEIVYKEGSVKQGPLGGERREIHRFNFEQP